MRIGGIASGMDTDQMIKDLMKAQRMPLDKLFQKKQTVDWKRDAFRDINLSLSKFRDDFSKMRLQSTFNAYSASSTNNSVVTAKASGTAVPGTYDIEVTQLAELGKLNSSNAITSNGEIVTSTTKVLEAGQTEEFTITNNQGLAATITVDDTDTYETLAKKINGAQDADGNTLGMRASFDNTTSRFFMSTREMGLDQGFTLEGTAFVQDQILGGGVEFSATGQDAILSFDGIDIEGNTTNKVTVHGINLDLVSAGVGKITVNSDPDAAFDTIKNFVESYNELIADLETKLIEPRYRDFPPLTEEERGAISDREAELWDKKAQSGLLRNDPILRATLDQLRRALVDPVEGIATGQVNTLSQIGITTGNYRDGGKLFIDEDQLRAALNDKPDEVMNLFSKSADEEGNQSQMGLGLRMNVDINATISRVRTKAGSSGTTSGDTSFLGKSISRLESQIAMREERLIQIEERYYRQFNAMEQVINRMNQQGDFIMANMFGDMQ